MSQTKYLIEERIETVTSEDHIVETFGDGNVNLNEERFMEFDGRLLRHTKDNPLFKSLRKGDKIITRVYAVEGSSILDITHERLLK